MQRYCVVWLTFLFSLDVFNCEVAVCFVSRRIIEQLCVLSWVWCHQCFRSEPKFFTHLHYDLKAVRRNEAAWLMMMFRWLFVSRQI